MKHILLLTAGFFAASVSFAQSRETPEMDTDRPSRSDASSTVPKGYFQLETGFLFQQDKTAFSTDRDLKLPALVARIGITKNLELRLRAEEHIASFSPENYDGEDLNSTRAGIDDIEIGGKFQFLESNGITPEAAIQAEVKLPLASHTFDTGQPEPRIRFAFTNDLSPKLKLQYNIGLNWEVNQNEAADRKYDHNPLYALNLNYAVTEKLETFVELYGEKTEDQTFQHGTDAGLGYLFLPNLKFDLSAGLGISENAPDYFVETGISFRLPR